MDVIESLFVASGNDVCRVATAHDAVLNSECCYTFHTPYTSDQGILVNLVNFIGTVDALAMLYNNNSNSKALFVRIVKERVEKQKTDDEKEKETAAPTKLAIGVEGGFPLDEDKYDIVSKHSVVVLEATDNNNEQQQTPKILAELPYTDETKASFPEALQNSVDSILCHAGVATQQDVQAWKADDTDIPVSKYAADLPFVDNGVLIDPHPATWKCQASGDTENLWLNLSDGYIGGGRKNWDGSGGSNGALDHYKNDNTGGKYPLVVKLGTITADLDTADCYSYAPDEDGPVKVPNLAELLAKRGINVAAMQKTVKSTAELEVELNANYAFDAITEAGAELQPLSGPGLQGLQNLGNSCYMNSVWQLLFAVPELSRRYGCAPSQQPQALTQHALLRTVAPTSAPTDVLCQTTKLACALTSGVFAKPILLQDDNDKQDSSTTDPKYRLAPRMMKHCIGKDHVDFRTMQQQDAAQFLQYFLERLDRAELGASSAQARQQLKKTNNGASSLHTASHLFSFSTSARLVCSADGKIKYKDSSAPETIWSLRVPMEKAKVVADDIASPEQKRLKASEGEGAMTDNKEEKVKKPVPTIALETCLEEWAGETTIDDLRWPHLGNAVQAATQTLSLSNFPRYLIVQIQRYELGPDWQPIKLEVNVQVPHDEELDLTKYKAKGPQDGENIITEQDEKAAAAAKTSPSAAPVLDEAALAQLMDMGFSLNSCKRALTAVGGNNVEAAMGWVFEHNMDPDFNDPLPESNNDAMDTSGDGGGGGGVDEGVVQSLVASLGAFTADQVRAALQETDGAADRAADWLFSHMDDLDGAIAALKNKEAQSGSGGGPAVPLEDGPAKYSLMGLVSHIGKNTGSGHYVAHLKKEGKWVIFNDEKVALSSKPPFEHAYLYLFQRSDTIGSPNSNY